MGDGLDVDGPAAPPRANGELVFTAPWERRVFGVTMALVEGGAFEYEAFRQRLIAAIAASDDDRYWQSWATALEGLLQDLGAVDAAALDARAEAYHARPHGHDH